MPIATNPQTGEVVYLDPQGQWVPAQTAVNPQTQEKLAFDGQGWQPVKMPEKGMVEKVTDAAGTVAANGEGIAGAIVKAVPPTISAPARIMLGDDTLTKAVKNAPASAVQFAKDMVQPFIAPVETATAIKNLGEGLLQKVGFLKGEDKEQYADAVGRFFVERYGSIAAVKKTIAEDPIGVLGDLSLVMSAGGAAAARAPGVASKVGETVRAVGNAVDPVNAAVAGVNATGRGAALVAGMTTGTGARPLREAAAAGAEGGARAEALQSSMRGTAPIDDVVSDAKAAVETMRQQRGNEYRAAMAKIGQDTTVLDFTKVDGAIQAAADVKTYKGQDLSPTTKGVRKEIVKAVDDWKKLDPNDFHTAEGLDALKQKLGDIRDAHQPRTPEFIIADRVYKGVRQTIIDQAPDYAKVMKGYEQASTIINDIEKTLSLNPKANVDTAVRKLQSVLRNNVHTNYGRREALADILVQAGAPHLLTKLAGQSLSAALPRGIAGQAGGVAAAVGPALGLVGGIPGAAMTATALPLFSPRAMGEAAYYSGKGSRALPVIGRSAFQAGRAERVSR